ncbi:hypothetical protein [Streptomyces sp. NPDC048577]|uniref:hypothetical protein n=1 Tax=Streptomyces sp. NPDC048577 TaxID=3157209 RepID=UPI00344A4AAD
MIATGWGQAADGLLWIEEDAMPSVLGLMEQREARARQDLESWTEVLEQAQVEVDAARERVERARVGREELVSVLAGESPVNALFAAVVAASGPVNGVELTRAVGREAEIKNEVEKIRHRAYVLEKRGWLVRARDGRFMPAPSAVARDASPASAERLRPGASTA